MKSKLTTSDGIAVAVRDLIAFLTALAALLHSLGVI
jgi:hypothetical protein